MYKILEVKNMRINRKKPHEGVVEILADTEVDILDIGETAQDGSLVVKPLPGSMAATADGSACYILSPSNVWTKVVGSTSGTSTPAPNPGPFNVDFSGVVGASTTDWPTVVEANAAFSAYAIKEASYSAAYQGFTVTMGGVDISNSALSVDNFGGYDIAIPRVTGDIVITGGWA